MTREELVMQELTDPRLEQDWNRLALELSKLGGVIPEFSKGTQAEYVKAIYNVVESGYAEFVRGSYVRRVKVNIDAVGAPKVETKPTAQMGFDW